LSWYRADEVWIDKLAIKTQAIITFFSILRTCAAIVTAALASS